MELKVETIGRIQYVAHGEPRYQTPSLQNKAKPRRLVRTQLSDELIKKLKLLTDQYNKMTAEAARLEAALLKKIKDNEAKSLKKIKDDEAKSLKKIKDDEAKNIEVGKKKRADQLPLLSQVFPNVEDISLNNNDVNEWAINMVTEISHGMHSRY